MPGAPNRADMARSGIESGNAAVQRRVRRMEVPSRQLGEGRRMTGPGGQLRLKRTPMIARSTTAPSVATISACQKPNASTPATVRRRNAPR